MYEDKIISGKEVSAYEKGLIANRVKALKEKGILPKLSVIIVGEDPASKVYVANKEKACEQIGMQSFKYALPEDTTEEELLALINKLNSDSRVNGILCQLPLPKHLNEELVINTIIPEKDVDAFHPQNVGKIMTGNYDFLPCTPAGIMEMLEYEHIDISGKECVVIGRSNIVGKPMAMLLLHKNGTVTICHSRTKDLKEVCRRADILVAAVGRANFVTADMVKEGAVVIDVGINRLENGKLCGDVGFVMTDNVTPVPGGVGLLTRAMLIKHVERDD